MRSPAVLIVLFAFAQPTSGNDDGVDDFVSIFDGRTLDGWHAVPSDSASDWTVRDGAIVGNGSADRLAYLVWKDEQLTDFEVELSYRLPGKGNTGVEIRSQPDLSGKRPFEGYHADLGHVGIGPHILGAWDFHFAKRKEYPCPRGTRLVIGEDGTANSTAIPNALTAQDVRADAWNHVRIVARGNHFQFFINGKLSSEFTDNAKLGRLDQGAIGLQIHDKGMRVEFKDLRLKRLKPTSASAWKINKQLYKARERDGAAAWVTVRYVGPKLQREEIHGFEGASDEWHDLGRRFSDDNGRTWSEFEPRPNTAKRVAGVPVHEHEGCVTYDSDAGVLLGAWLRQLPVEGRWHNFTYYRISSDFGRTWTTPKQLRYEEGEDFDPARPHHPGYLQRNNAYFGTSILRHSNGTLILPVAHANAVGDPDNDRRAWRMGSLCFIGKWDAAAKDYVWMAGERVEISPDVSSRGLMEPDLVELTDGRVLVVWRGSNTARTPGRKWFSLSDDGCKTLSQPQEWRYSDGSRFYSPSSIHRFIRHTVTGKVYWFGNICPEPPQGNSPRYPLIVAEVDEERAALKKETVTVIDDRAPQQPAGIQFSNFSLLENRETHELELYLTPIGSDAQDWRNADCYKYTLTVPGTHRILE